MKELEGRGWSGREGEGEEKRGRGGKREGREKVGTAHAIR